MDENGREVGTQLEARPEPDVNESEALVRLALEKGADVDVLERMVALEERVTARNAEMALAEALAAFQANCPPIPRVGTAEVKKNGVKKYEYHFAPLDEIVRVIRPHLVAQGLSYTHDSRIGDGQVEVTCTLQHVMGATRKATFRGPFDQSGGKNPLQAVGSSRSYGRRYTLIDVLGLATEEDDDGAGSGGGGEPRGVLSESQVEVLNMLADESGADKRAFCEWLGVESFKDIPVGRYKDAKSALEVKVKQAKGEEVAS